MKLLQKTNRYYLIFGFCGLLVGSILLFFAIRFISAEELEEGLENTQQHIKLQIAKGDNVIHLPPIIETKLLDNPTTPSKIWRDTMIYDEVEQEEEAFRQLTVIEKINGQHYAITVRASWLETEDYLWATGLSIFGVWLLLLLSLFFLNKWMNKRIWSSFYHNLEAIKDFSIQQPKAILLKSSNIEEFETLTQTLKTLTQKAQADYKILKEFTENAAHELQTPLTIIQSKVETLIQQDGLTAATAQELEKILLATHRLSTLNQNLLLMVKIENRQFDIRQSVNIAEPLQKQLTLFETLTSMKEISVEKNITNAVFVKTNPILLDLLLSNLLKNAVQHNIKNGAIKIHLTQGQLSISNTGTPLTTDPKLLFQRFQKAQPASASLGLGLSIVQQICVLHGWQVNYTFYKKEKKEDDWHQITINFKIA